MRTIIIRAAHAAHAVHCELCRLERNRHCPGPSIIDYATASACIDSFLNNAAVEADEVMIQLADERKLPELTPANLAN